MVVVDIMHVILFLQDSKWDCTSEWKKLVGYDTQFGNEEVFRCENPFIKFNRNGISLKEKVPHLNILNERNNISNITKQVRVVMTLRF